MIPSASSNRSTRTGGGGKGMPLASCSACAQPVPRPSSSRPSVSRSTVAAWRASNTGWCNALLMTSCPTRSVVVTSAALTRGLNGSTMPRWSGTWSVLVAEGLGLAGEVLPLAPRPPRDGLQREAERLHDERNRSPASTATESRFPCGASGQLHLGSNAHDGEYAKLRSITSLSPAPPRSAPFAVSST